MILAKKVCAAVDNRVSDETSQIPMMNASEVVDNLDGSPFIYKDTSSYLKMRYLGYDLTILKRREFGHDYQLSYNFNHAPSDEKVYVYFNLYANSLDELKKELVSARKEWEDNNRLNNVIMNVGNPAAEEFLAALDHSGSIEVSKQPETPTASFLKTVVFTRGENNRLKGKINGQKVSITVNKAHGKEIFTVFLKKSDTHSYRLAAPSLNELVEKITARHEARKLGNFSTSSVASETSKNKTLIIPFIEQNKGAKLVGGVNGKSVRITKKRNGSETNFSVHLTTSRVLVKHLEATSLTDIVAKIISFQQKRLGDVRIKKPSESSQDGFLRVFIPGRKEPQLWACDSNKNKNGELLYSRVVRVGPGVIRTTAEIDWTIKEIKAQKKSV